jgi:glycine/D-amino acid oxidase-like deaminating enzyme
VTAPIEPHGRIVGSVGTDAIARPAEPMGLLQKATVLRVRNVLREKIKARAKTADPETSVRRVKTKVRAKNVRRVKTAGNVGTATIAAQARIEDPGRNALRAKTVLLATNANALSLKPTSPRKVYSNKCPKDLASCVRRTTTT